MHRRHIALISSGIALILPGTGWADSPSPQASSKTLVSLSALSKVRIGVNESITEPINGFIAQVVFELTDEHNNNIGFGISEQSTTPGGSTLPAGGSAHFAVATFDTGSTSNIINASSYPGFDFPGSGREGFYTVTVEGVSGTEELLVTKGIGTYMTGFSNATVTAGTLGAPISSLRGQIDVPALVSNPEDILPNIMGTPMLAHYRATIQNSQAMRLTVGAGASATTFKSPNVSFSSLSTSLPAGYLKLTLDTEGTDTTPLFGGPFFETDTSSPPVPTTPAQGAFMFAHNSSTGGEVTVSKNGNTASNLNFLFDTGAQLSIISTDTATALGIDTLNGTPDFDVDVGGIGGISTAPGYFIDSLSLTAQGGTPSWNRVPVVVIDVGMPTDPSQAIPGILGTNLFGDRDLIINVDGSSAGRSFLGIGPQMQWNKTTGGTWNTASNWDVVLPNGIDMQANFYGKIMADSTITISSPVTTGSITFDNSHRYTISGSAITLSVSLDQAPVIVRNGSHTIAAPVTLASDSIVDVIPTASTLTVSGVVGTSGGAHGITKVGPGTLLLTGSNTYTGATVVQDGTVELSVNARDPVLTLAGGADIQSGRLVFDYTAGNNPATTIKSLLTTSHASNFATGKLRSSTIDGTNTLGWKDDTGALQVIVGYTLYGDTNLDGTVGVTDLGNLASNYGTASGATWVKGDFDYNGTVDVTDLGNLAGNFGLTLESASATAANVSIGATVAAGAVVPEPASLATLALVGAFALRRRR